MVYPLNCFATLLSMIGGSPISAFHAMVWDALLDIIYVMIFALVLYMARLINACVFRPLEVIT